MYELGFRHNAIFASDLYRPSIPVMAPSVSQCSKHESKIILISFIAPYTWKQYEPGLSSRYNDTVCNINFSRRSCVLIVHTSGCKWLGPWAWLATDGVVLGSKVAQSTCVSLQATFFSPALSQTLQQWASFTWERVILPRPDFTLALPYSSGAIWNNLNYL